MRIFFEKRGSEPVVYFFFFIVAIVDSITADSSKPMNGSQGFDRKIFSSGKACY